MLLALLALVGLLVLAYFIYVNWHPTFGGDVSKELQREYAQRSSYYEDGKFVNIGGVTQDMSFDKSMKIIRKMLFNNFPNAKPKEALPFIKADSMEVADYKNASRLLWFGHSAFLLQTEGRNVLIDPMLTQMPSPVPRDAQKRFNREIPIEIKQLPHIDLVLISHDHYDHLDYKSIKQLKDKVAHFAVPLGVGVHLEAWGVTKDKITEMNWWDEFYYKGLHLACTPAQHFSGRKFDNGGSTLWASWVIKSSTESIFFSGDSGYGSHFKEIGETYGPFDFAMMECGQYDALWPEIHMMPEETIQAGIDVKARWMMPIHWGAFQLAMHDSNDPVKRAVKKAKELDISLATPKIGEPIMISNPSGLSENWW